MAPADDVILITGGAQGIGKGIALNFLNSGWRVAAADIDDEAGHEISAEYDPDRLVYIHTDVGDDDSAARCVRKTLDLFGQINVLVNNAGIADQHFGNFHAAPENWEKVIRTNLTGCFFMSRHAAPSMPNGSSIINVSSTRALQSEPDSEAYAASKGGIIALTHAMAVSLGPRIRVNCISPGWIDVTEWKKSRNRAPANLSEDDHSIHPAGRVGIPADIAGMIEYLASDAAGFITGQNFVVDGGMTSKMIYH